MISVAPPPSMGPIRFGQRLCVLPALCLAIVVIGCSPIPPALAADISPRDSLPDVRGVQSPLISSDSTTLLLLVDAHCGACRNRIAEYRILKDRAREINASLRIVLPNDRMISAQFARLLDLDARVYVDSGAVYFQKFAVVTVPTLIAFNTRGKVIREWVPWDPQLTGKLR